MESRRNLRLFCRVGDHRDRHRVDRRQREMGIRDRPTIIQIFGNVLLLCPLSFFMLYFKITSTAGKTLLVIFLTSCGIELLQFAQTTMITGFESISLPPKRSTDIDDIILNTLSGLIGILLAYALPSVRKRINKRR
ncbi:VanZ family protein [Listeria monocytogenes]|uniref:VanZ family protein n=1 Tax=Listeria monocytogenes TaxID=1639 RepID=UPI003F7FED1B